MEVGRPAQNLQLPMARVHRSQVFRQELTDRSPWQELTDPKANRMKSDRRHELEQNVLADRLGAGIESVQSFLPTAIGAIVVVTVLALGWGLYSSSSQRKASAAWTDYYFNLEAGDADAFADIAEKYDGSVAGAWALQTAGNGYLENGLQTLYVNKADGEALIQKAIDEFSKLESQSDPVLRSKALLGLAQAYESLGEIDKAAGYYDRVAKSTTQPRLISKANERIAFLNSQPGKEFYAWFKSYAPKPGAAITLPENFLNPPTTPDIEFSVPGDTSGSPPTDGSGANLPVLDPEDLPKIPDVAEPQGELELTPPADGVADETSVDTSSGE